jgi:hypothetical protein
LSGCYGQRCQRVASEEAGGTRKLHGMRSTSQCESKVGVSGYMSSKKQATETSSEKTIVVLTMMLMLSAVLRDAIMSLHGPEVPFGLPQALLVLGILVLILVLAGVVLWRVRWSPRTRSK